MSAVPPIDRSRPPRVVRRSFLPATRIRVHAKYGGCCAYCGVEISLLGMQIDHIVARAHGGANVFENLNPACASCNKFKTVWSLEEFRAELAAQVDRARRGSLNFRLAERFGLVRVVSTDVVFHFERTDLQPGADL